MIHAIKQQVIVQPDGRIELHAPELKPGTLAEVIILETTEPLMPRSLVSLIGTGQGSFPTPADADAFLRGEREIWG